MICACGHARSLHHSAGGGWAGYGDVCNECECDDFIRSSSMMRLACGCVPGVGQNVTHVGYGAPWVVVTLTESESQAWVTPLPSATRAYDPRYLFNVRDLHHHEWSPCRQKKPPEPLVAPLPSTRVIAL